MTIIAKLVAEILNNQVCLGILGFSLVMIPIIGIAKIHEFEDERIKFGKINHSERVSGDD